MNPPLAYESRRFANGGLRGCRPIGFVSHQAPVSAAPRRGGTDDPRPFEYHAPTSVEAALALLATHGGERNYWPAGHSLLPMMKLRFADPAHLIDLNRIDTLKGIRLKGNEIRIGAMTSENDLNLVAAADRALPPAGRDRAFDFRSAGTLSRHHRGGTSRTVTRVTITRLSCCVSAASFVLRGSGGERVVPAEGYFLGTTPPLSSPTRS